jgi:putative ABC transport system permease protein
MSIAKIAFRNVFRNRRRSTMTVSTIIVGAVSVLLIGAMLSFVTLDFQSSVIRRSGHLTIYKKGYFEFGAGNSSAYGIGDYPGLAAIVRDDPVLRPMITVVTPVQDVLGLAGNYQADRSKPFFGRGIVPRDHARMRQWDDFHLGTAGSSQPELPDDLQAGVVGIGMGRILGLCAALHIARCNALPQATPANASAAADQQIQQLSALRDADHPGPDTNRKQEQGARIDLLAATAGGAPNVVGMNVDHAESQGSREIDDNYVLMHLELAQQLAYGRGEHKVTGIVLQLRRSSDLQPARTRLYEIFKARHLDLEVRDFSELTPLYKQVLAFFAFLFSFVAIVLAVIVLFTVVNTMSMAVMERIDEIGTARALGLTRAKVRRQFLLEGCLLGVIGATLGVAVAAGIAWLMNVSNVSWTPPTAAGPVPLKLFISDDLSLGTWLCLVALAALAALFPANRASRMNVVDALRHV